MNIIEAIRDKNLFRPFLGDNPKTFRPLLTCLRMIYGLPIVSDGSRQLVTQLTGRDPDLLPDTGFAEALILTGRRSGKSRQAALIAAYEAILSGNHKKLSAGEIGMVAICSPSKFQSGIVKSYLRAIFESPLLAREIIRETQMGFELRNGVQIGILAGDWRLVRGFTLLAAVIDELCFFGVEDSKVRSDSELIAALRPGLQTTGGKLIGISSVYAKRGFAYDEWKRSYGNDLAKVLVVHAPSRVMNPTLDQASIDRELQRDYNKASAEYLSQWRDDVGLLVPRELLESLVVQGRIELPPQPGISYSAFCDVSGGRSDDATLCIAHRQDRKIVIDALKKWSPPFNPYEIIGRMAYELQRWGINRITGDNYSAEFTNAAFKANRINYTRSELNKSELYLELLPRLCSGEVELLDNETVINQLAGLERRTRVGGRDSVDHLPGQHDDLANALAGVASLCVERRVRVGGFGRVSRQTIDFF